MIASLCIPCFAAACALQGGDSRDPPALLVVDAVSPQRVLGVSPDLLARGLRPGITLREAQTRAPAARTLPLERRALDARADQVLALLQQWSSRVGLAAAPWLSRRPAWDRTPDNGAASWLLDLGPQRTKAAHSLAAELMSALACDLGFQGQIGLAAGPVLATLAMRRAPATAITLITAGQERATLAPLPLMLVEHETPLAERLALLGLRTFGQLATLPRAAVAQQFGARGRWLHALARGEDEERFAGLPDLPAEHTRRVFQGVLADQHALRQASRRQLAGLAARLARRGYQACALVLTLELEDGGVWTSRYAFSTPTSQTALLGPALDSLWNSVIISCGVEAQIVELRELVPAQAVQQELLAPTQGTRGQLRQVLKGLIARSGTPCFYRVAPEAREGGLPEEHYTWREIDDV